MVRAEVPAAVQESHTDRSKAARCMVCVWEQAGTRTDRAGLNLSIFQSLHSVFLCPSNFFCWVTIMPSVPEKREGLWDIVSSKCWEEGVMAAVTARCWRRDSPACTAPLSSKQESSRSQEGQPSSLRQVVSKGSHVFTSNSHHCFRAQAKQCAAV